MQLSDLSAPSGGGLNCTQSIAIFRAHQTFEWMGDQKKKSMKAQIQRRHLGGSVAPLNTRQAKRSEGAGRPNLGKDEATTQSAESEV